MRVRVFENSKLIYAHQRSFATRAKTVRYVGLSRSLLLTARNNEQSLQIPSSVYSVLRYRFLRRDDTGVAVVSRCVRLLFSNGTKTVLAIRAKQLRFTHGTPRFTARAMVVMKPGTEKTAQPERCLMDIAAVGEKEIRDDDRWPPGNARRKRCYRLRRVLARLTETWTVT